MALLILRDFLPLSDVARFLRWRSDSTTALAYVRYEGGTISLYPSPRERSSSPRSLSSPPYPPRLHPDGGEPPRGCGVTLPVAPDWRLPPAIFDAFCLRWGCPVIDLFAMTASTHLPRFFAWGDAHEAEAFDALARRWSFRLAYAFPPPPPLLPRVLGTLAVSTSVFLLVSPHGPTQRWFPALLRLQVEEVFRLPTRPEVVDLTSDLPPLPRLPLLAGKLFGGSTTSTSRTPSSPTSAAAGEDRQLDDMTSLRSASLSAILPLFEGGLGGDSPCSRPSVSWFFDRRPPPSRRLFPSWDVASVFAVFAAFFLA